VTYLTDLLEIAYKNVAFYLTNRGYGVYYDHADHVSVEIQSDIMSKVQASVPGETIRFYIIAGSTPKEILTRYTLLTGRPPLPPDWSYGLWLSTSFLTSYDEKTVMQFVDGMEERDIPLHVFHFDCFWMPAHEWCNFTFDPEYFPDPAGFLGRLHERGLKVCVWINPYIGQESRLFAEGDEKGYFIRRVTGETWQTDDWQAGMAVVDFTNPEATEWYKDQLRGLVKLGVDSFKTDFGERIPANGVLYHDKSNPRAMHNF
jgi:alpha-D-xyloside xylohydrolase